MNELADITDDLRAHLALVGKLWDVAEREGQHLRRPEGEGESEASQARRQLLPQLNGSLDKLRRHRVGWQQLPAGERIRRPEVASLLRENQDLIMKTIVLDRENEQMLLRRGLVPPGQLPSINRQRPHFVAELYRRQTRS